jgi:RES domain
MRENGRLSLATIDETELEELLDLDDPRNLVARQLRPSGVATRDRELTQPLALSIYQEGTQGFEWWSAIEASWINVTLFEDRAVDRLAVAGEPEPLTIDHPVVREAAEAVGVLLAR